MGFVGIYNMGIEGFSDEEISDHVKYLHQEGFIEARNVPSLDGDKWHPERVSRVLDI
ncbi:MAG: hypothetical protein OXG10_05625 [Candidatus Dadabacteria bacterium]|nr:hypothetical protein [Candidatus Dadabacteria bacterium]